MYNFFFNLLLLLMLSINFLQFLLLWLRLWGLYNLRHLIINLGVLMKLLRCQELTRSLKISKRLQTTRWSLKGSQGHLEHKVSTTITIPQVWNNLRDSKTTTLKIGPKIIANYGKILNQRLKIFFGFKVASKQNFKGPPKSTLDAKQKRRRESKVVVAWREAEEDPTYSCQR